jgi:Fur family transcriptional regulator, ferric uptake regulator
MATAYRTLSTFVEAGFVRQVELSAGKAFYEIASAHHHHIVCGTCNRIEDVDVCLPEALTAAVRKASGFALVQEHTLEFFGTCKRCARAV